MHPLYDVSGGNCRGAGRENDGVYVDIGDGVVDVGRGGKTLGGNISMGTKK